MIGQTISHFKILEELGETRLRSLNFGGQGDLITFRFVELRQLGLVLRSPISSSEVNQ